MDTPVGLVRTHGRGSLMSRFFIPKLSLCFLVAVFVTPAFSESVSLSPVKDTSLFSNGDLANGSGNHMLVGLTQAFGVRRALVQYDVAGSLPPGSIITSVTFQARVNRSRNAVSQINLHRLTSDWGEGPTDATGAEGQGAAALAGDATWAHRVFPTDFWTTPGGDFSPTVSGTRNVTGNTTWSWSSTPQMVADVQGWFDDPANNFGWILIGTETGIFNAKRMNTRVAVVEANRPLLNVEFIPGCVYGNVNENGVGGIEDVLTINGSVGTGAERRVSANIGDPIQFDLVAASGGPSVAEYVLWVWPGDLRSILDLNVSSELIGCTVNPTPFDGAMMQQPIVCIHSAGADPMFCGTSSIRMSPVSAPFTINRMGFNNAKLFTLQGILQDSTVTNAFGFSVSNAVILDVN